jgi:hypothetical protein
MCPVFVWRWLCSDQREQRFDDPAEKTVEPEEENAKDARHDDHHDRGHYRFATGGPGDPRGFSANLTHEFARRCLCHDDLALLLDQTVPITGKIRAKAISMLGWLPVRAKSSLWQEAESSLSARRRSGQTPFGNHLNL